MPFFLGLLSASHKVLRSSEPRPPRPECRAPHVPRDRLPGMIWVIGPARIWTAIAGFRVQSANRYTTGPTEQGWIQGLYFRWRRCHVAKKKDRNQPRVTQHRDQLEKGGGGVPKWATARKNVRIFFATTFLLPLCAITGPCGFEMRPLEVATIHRGASPPKKALALL